MLYCILLFVVCMYGEFERCDFYVMTEINIPNVTRDWWIEQTKPYVSSTTDRR
jgi:hypothetical protein